MGGFFVDYSVYYLRFLSTYVYSCLKRSQYKLFVRSGSCLPLMVGPQLLQQTRSKVPCVLKFEPSPLLLPMLHTGSSPALPFIYSKCMRTFNFREIFKCAFKIYGIWPQASMLQTHVRNAVLLVWGSLRLTPIKVALGLCLLNVVSYLGLAPQSAYCAGACTCL